MNGSITYAAEDWRLFIDSSIRSLKAVLLHNASVPIAHPVMLNENYRNLDFVLKNFNYNSHNWQLCGDLKIITILLGQQGGFTKFPCLLCEWDSRDRNHHWTRKQWPARDKLEPGSKNVVHEHLIDPSKVLLPPLHIKLGLIKQFVKALKNHDSNAF